MENETMSLVDLLKYTKLSIATVYRYMSSRAFPKPSKIGGKVY